MLDRRLRLISSKSKLAGNLVTGILSKSKTGFSQRLFTLPTALVSFQNRPTHKLLNRDL